MSAAFDVDEFVKECLAANGEAQPQLAVRDVLERALAQPGAITDAIGPDEGGLTVLYGSDELTVMHVVWAPRMRLFPHNHRMWAVIGIYGGQEDNEFFRRPEPGSTSVVDAGGKSITTGDVLVLGDDAIHAVTNPMDRLTGAIHVYGGDFVNKPRSQWGPGELEERPYDMDEVLRQFDEGNRHWRQAPTEF